MSETALETASELLGRGLANALAATAMAAIVAAVTFPLRRRRPAVVHALWLLVLLKLVTPPLWTVAVQWPAKADTGPTVSGAAPVDPTYDTYAFVEAVAPDPLPTPASPATPMPSAPVNWLHLGTAVLGLVWLTGSGACLLLVIVRSVQFRRLLRLATPARPDVTRRVRRLGARLGIDRCPAAFFMPGAFSPMLYAAGRPRLLLPQLLWDRLDDEQRDTLVAHELAHFRRRDHWVRYVEVAATVLYWWFPILWWARRGLREAEEQCCDAWVVWSLPSAVRGYMSAILEAVEFVSEPYSEPNTVGGTSPFAPPAVPALASGMGEFRRLERRLWMIRQSKSPHRLGRPAFFGVLLGAAALPLAPTLAGQDGPVTEERRDVIVTQAEPAITDPLTADPLTAEVTEDVTVTFSPDVKTDAAGEVVVSTSDDVLTDRIFDARTGNTIEVRGKNLRIVQGSDLERARAEVQAARANLEAATRRLKELEARSKNNDVKFGWKGAQKPGKADDVDPKLKMKKGETHYKEMPLGYADAPSKSFKSGDKKPAEQDQRMDMLEQRIHQLGQMLHEMRQERNRAEDNGSDKAPAPGNRTF